VNFIVVIARPWLVKFKPSALRVSKIGTSPEQVLPAIAIDENKARS